MKKLFFCLFSTIFIALCVWLGLNTECYGYYEQATSNSIYYVKTSDNNLFTSCSNFQDVCGVLETIGNFYYKNDDSILLCSYNELFSDNYVYTIDTADYSTFTINFYFNIQNSSYNLSKFNFDTNGIDKYYNNNTNYTPCCRLTISLYNNNKSLYEMYFVRYDSGNFVYIYPKARPINTSGRTQFNDMYSESYTNITMNFNNSVLGSSTPSPVEPPSNEDDEQGGYGGFFETIIGVITDEYNAVVDFFTNLPEIFMHIFIPTKDEYEDLTERFNDQITDRFLIIPLTRNGESYDNTDKYAFIGGNKPHLLIYGYDFDMNELYTALRTPINFGYVQDSNVQSFWYRVDNSNVTPYFIINFVIMVNFIAMNMALYNKFFDKE